MRILPLALTTTLSLCLSFATAIANDHSVSLPAQSGAVAQAKDGTSLYLLVEHDRVVLHVGTPDADSLAMSLTDSVTIAGDDTALFGKSNTGGDATMLITEQDELILAWSQQGASFISSCGLNGDASRALEITNYSEAVQLSTGSPTSAAINSVNGQPVICGYSKDNNGTIWVASRNDGKWITETVVVEVEQTKPQVSVSRRGVTHVVWRDSSNAVWHLENTDAIGENSQWLRSGGTSHQAEQIGTSTDTPSLLAVRHQLLVALTTAESQVEYSLYTGQSWEKNRPCTMSDKRWNKDTLSQPQIVADGLGIPWLFFVSNTGERMFLYYTRWLGFGWDTIRQARGIHHIADDGRRSLAPIQGYVVPRFVRSAAREIGFLLINRDIPKPLRPFRIQTPSQQARPGTNILFLDMLDVGRSYWTEQVMLPAEKHPEAPLLSPSGDLETLDSHRVFNGGNILKEDGIYKAWYGAVNPIGDWFANKGQAWKSMLHLCYATSPDGINWTKPNLGLYEFKGNTNNNGLGVSTELSSELRFFHGPIRVMRNPDDSDPDRTYLSVPPGYYSADGLKWNTQEIAFERQGSNAKWVDYHSIIIDPNAPASRRWRAYGCTGTYKAPMLRSICYAYSPDGIHWTEDAENPVLLAETGGYFNKAHDVGTCLYKGHTLMIYQTANGYDQHLELAVSRDGRNFVRIHDGQPIIEQGKGDAFDRGLHLPVDPVIDDEEIRLYYGAADYRAPDDPPYEFERWKHCKLQLGLATLPIDGWTFMRNLPGKNVGYVTTVPIDREDLQNTVLTLNVRCQDKGHFLVELLDGETDERIPGYEMENSDHVEQTGISRIVSWKGNASLRNVKRDKFRIRVILVGKGDAARLHSIGFREDSSATAPEVPKEDERLISECLEYPSSVSNVAPLKSWIAHRPDGKKKPVVVVMHGFGEPVYRHGGRRMRGAVRYYALKDMFAIGVDLRGREESDGQRDNGGIEVMDIYDAVQAVLKKYPNEADADAVNIIGWSGGGGNTFSAVTRMPDLFSNAGAFYGITDYGYWANTAFKGALESDIGGTPAEVPNRYAARNSLLGVSNNAYTNFHFFWDEEETICPAWMDEEYRRIAKELKYDNITAHESKTTDKFRWPHTGSDSASSAEAERIVLTPFLAKNNPAIAIKPSGKLMVLGYLMTKRFQTLFGQGNDTVVELEYDLKDDVYDFNFALKTTDENAKGWLKVPDRNAKNVVAVNLNGNAHPFEATPSGQIMIRNISGNDQLSIQFSKAK